MILTFFIIWLLGSILTFCGEAYFSGSFNNDLVFLFMLCCGWFVVVPVILVVVFVRKTYSYIKELGRQRRSYK